MLSKFTQKNMLTKLNNSIILILIGFTLIIYTLIDNFMKVESYKRI